MLSAMDSVRELTGFLAEIDTGFLATTSADGQPYVQHRGGPKGFIRIVDDETLGFVDMVGNRQYLTVGNLEDNDRVLLFLIDYERRRRVKVWGRARVVTATPELVEQLRMEGQRGKVDHVMLITVTRWDVNCPAHIPQKVDAREAAARIRALEEENARLRALLP
jgi:uncharacterized protein